MFAGGTAAVTQRPGGSGAQHRRARQRHTSAVALREKALAPLRRAAMELSLQL